MLFICFNFLLYNSKKREVVPDLAPMLWHSFGTVAALLQEIVNIYPYINPPALTAHQSNRVLNQVATFILQKILLDETGLSYICQTYERFSHVAMILGKMVIALAKEPSARLLKHVVRCYLRLSDNQRARGALRQCLPDQLKDQTFMAVLKDDNSTKRWLAQLIKNLTETSAMDPRGIPMPPQ
eukprot:XP_011664320.1 PREDICTED: cell differentiation protein RCD1 homolog [Strongylocentrotus purpuratus]